MKNTVKQEVISEQRYRAICRNIYGYVLGGNIVFGILSVILFVAVIGQLIEGKDGMWSTLFIAYYALVFFLLSNFMRLLFKRLKESDTPFRYDIADKMKGAAGVLTFGSLAGMVLFIVYMLFFYSAALPDFFIVQTVNIVILVIGMILQAFALIFEYGCKLQQESDETL